MCVQVQSRSPGEGGSSATLDALRGGEAGDTISLDSVKLEDLFTTELLPS
jgi:hypothetical protein